MNIANILTIIGFIIVGLVIITLLAAGIYVFFVDRTQRQHPVLRNYPLVGRARYFFEKIGPEMRQYFFNNDNEGKPFSRNDYQHVVKKAKYKRDVFGFGSQRNFEEEGYYVRNSLFPKLTEELKMDQETKATTGRYLLIKDPLFTQRKEEWEEDESSVYLLDEKDTIVVGENCKHPFRLRGQIGMSAMSYGSLGDRAITALSKGLGMAKGTWMNTGEGGLSDYHLEGGVDIIMQIGPGMFGVRDKEGNFNWDELLEKSKIPQLKAFEVKLAQGAKTRGGHVDAEKVTEEIARIRMVEPYQSIDSPNRFPEFDSIPKLFDFIDKVREHTGMPVGMKIVIGSHFEAEELAKQIKELGTGPDFITVDGSEGGTGASYQELADSVGLPIRSALPLVDYALKRHGVRDRQKIFASGKLISPDLVAMALSMGADCVNIARGYMFTVGCIQTLKCESNACPVGVTTTDPELQRALVVDEKKHRTANYTITMRKGLFRIAAAAGLDSPVHFKREHVVYKDDKGKTWSLDDIYLSMVEKDGDGSANA